MIVGIVGMIPDTRRLGLDAGETFKTTLGVEKSQRSNRFYFPK